MLKAACVNTDAWAWLALVARYDGYGELNKRAMRAK
jgi:hypothetical protein